jgi:hypothetical protein
MRAHLPECDACRGYYERRLRVSLLDPKALTAPDRLGRPLGLGGRGWRRGWVSALAVAVAALFTVWMGPRSEPRFQARGGAAAPAASPSTSVTAYRLGPSRLPVPVGSAVQSSDELAFAYRNSAGKQRLFVVGVDEHGHSFWFHPAWTDASQNPEGVRIQKSDALVELPAAVRHRLEGRSLQLRAIFTDEPLTVRDIEERIRATAPDAALLRLAPQTVQQSLQLRVNP